MASRKKTSSKSAPWDRPNPRRTHKKLSPAQQARARAAARKAGRRYPNLVDNMNAAKRR